MYLMPVVTLIGGALILDENVTVLSIAGVALTIGGLCVSERWGDSWRPGRRAPDGSLESQPHMPQRYHDERHSQSCLSGKEHRVGSIT